MWSVLEDLVLDTPTSPKEESAEIPKAEIVQPGQVHLSNLDNLVTLAIITSTAEEEGALTKDQAQDAIKELVELNSLRHQSYFHKGFGHVLLEDPLVAHFPEENQSRRLWYLAGAIVGFARRSDHSAIVEIFDSEDISSFGREAEPRSLLGARLIFEALCHQGRVSEAGDFIASPMIAYAGMFEVILAWGTGSSCWRVCKC